MKQRRLPSDFWWLWLLLVLSQIPGFSSYFVPSNDTLGVYQFFHLFYSNLVTHHELLRWLPVGLDGIGSELFYWQNMTPSRYLCALLGLAFGLGNTLFLFKLSLLIDASLLLGGTYALCQRLFIERAATAFVCIGVLTTIFWETQIHWNFQAWYLTPAILYLLVRFFETGEWRLLTQSLIVFFFSLQGHPPYAIPMHVFFYLSFTLSWIFLVDNPFRRISVFRLTDRRNIIPICFLVFIGVVYFFNFRNALEHMVVYSGLRDPVTQKNSLFTFLTFGWPTSEKFLELLFAAPQASLNTTFYIGLIPLLFIIAGLPVVRERRFELFLVIAILFSLVRLSYLTPVAPLLFSFPMMSYFRQIGVVLPLVKFSLLVASGFGVQAFFSGKWRLRRHLRLLRKGAIGIFLIALVLTVLVGKGGIPYFAEIRPSSGPSPVSFVFLMSAVAMCLISILWIKRDLSQKQRVSIVLGFLIFELFSYRSFLYFHMPIHREGINPSGFLARPYAFEPFRFESRAQHPNAEKAEAFIRRAGAKEAWIDAFLNIDTCEKNLRRNLINRGVDRLYRARLDIGLDDLSQTIPEQALAKDYLLNENFAPAPPEGDRVLRALLGCNSQKLRVVTNVQSAKSLQDAAAMTRNASIKKEAGTFLQMPIERFPTILRHVGGDRQASPELCPGRVPNKSKIEVTHFTFNTLSLFVETPPAGCFWLLYLDGWHPGWRATVNGHATEILEANLAYKEVHLEPGPNRVHFAFGPSSNLNALFLLVGMNAFVGAFGLWVLARGKLIR